MKTRQRGGFLNTIKESMSNMYAKAKETVTKKKNAFWRLSSTLKKGAY